MSLRDEIREARANFARACELYDTYTGVIDGDPDHSVEHFDKVHEPELNALHGLRMKAARAYQRVFQRANPTLPEIVKTERSVIPAHLPSLRPSQEVRAGDAKR